MNRKPQCEMSRDITYQSLKRYGIARELFLSLFRKHSRRLEALHVTRVHIPVGENESDRNRCPTVRRPIIRRINQSGAMRLTD